MAVSFGKDGSITRAFYVSGYPDTYPSVRVGINGTDKRISSTYSFINGVNKNLMNELFYWDRYKILEYYRSFNFNIGFPTFYFNYPTRDDGTMEVPYTGGRVNPDTVYSSLSFNSSTGKFTGLGSKRVTGHPDLEGYYAIYGYQNCACRLTSYYDESLTMWDGSVIGNGNGYEYDEYISIWPNNEPDSKVYFDTVTSNSKSTYTQAGYASYLSSYFADDQFGSHTDIKYLVCDSNGVAWSYYHKGKY